MAARPNWPSFCSRSRDWPREAKGKRRLIYLGDMINRGPDSAGVLELWAQSEAAHGVDHVDRLMGNHEIMMMLAVIGGPHAHKAETMWLSKRMGGQKLLDQMAARAGHAGGARRPGAAQGGAGRRRRAPPAGHALRTCGSATRCSFMAVSTRMPILDEFLARPWTDLHRGALGLDQPRLPRLEGRASAARWWCTATRRPTSTSAISGMDDPHLFEGDRLGLDGGSARTGIVTAAEIQDGRYRILKAGTPFENPEPSGE